jgi:hypothetical protein
MQHGGTKPRRPPAAKPRTTGRMGVAQRQPF